MSLPPDFRGLRVSKSGESVSAELATLPLADLGSSAAGEALVEVEYSSLNYKDALASTGHPGVVRRMPLVPGIDAAGRVVESGGRFSVGNEVLVTGFELGTERWGGFGRYIRVPEDWLLPLPPLLDARTAMIYGTAGLTAAMSVDVILQHGVSPASGEVLVTGASGGVGSLAVGILARLGFRAVAVSRKPEAVKMLTRQGAARVIGLDEVTDASDRPLLKARWSAAIDSLGGKPLADILRGTVSQGCVAACGLVAGIEVPLTVYPFILRGVHLAGIDSPYCPLPPRQKLWAKLAGEWRPPELESLVRTIGLDDLLPTLREMLAGKSHGRVVLAHG